MAQQRSWTIQLGCHQWSNMRAFSLAELFLWHTFWWQAENTDIQRLLFLQNNPCRCVLSWMIYHWVNAVYIEPIILNWRKWSQWNVVDPFNQPWFLLLTPIKTMLYCYISDPWCRYSGSMWDNCLKYAAKFVGWNL